MAEAFQAAGHLIGGIGAYESGKYNRDVARTQAIEAERDGTVEEARIRDAARAAIGDQVAAQGANGFQQGTGSAIDALTQSQINATLDALNARRTAASRARGLRQQGEIAYSAGSNAMVQGMFGAAASVLPSRSDWASARAGSSGGGGVSGSGKAGSSGGASKGGS